MTFQPLDDEQAREGYAQRLERLRGLRDRHDQELNQEGVRQRHARFELAPAEQADALTSRGGKRQ